MCSVEGEGKGRMRVQVKGEPRKWLGEVLVHIGSLEVHCRVMVGAGAVGGCAEGME